LQAGDLRRQSMD